MNEKSSLLSAGRTFDKSIQSLYNAWIQEEQLKQWWQPAGNQLVQVENQVKENGMIRYQFETKDGSPSFTITGQYQTVVPAQKLVYTWTWHIPGSEHAAENRFELTVEFAGDDKQSSIHITQRALDGTEPLHPHQQGWEEALEHLKTFLG